MKPLIFVLLLNLTQLCNAQEEGYASVSSINHNILVLNNCVDEYQSFKVNQKIIVIQKESASVIQINKKSTGQTAVARKYVVLTITEVERSDNVVTSIKVSRDLQNSFLINNANEVDVRIVSRWNW
jgi:hypothetical protein